MGLWAQTKVPKWRRDENLRKPWRKQICLSFVFATRSVQLSARRFLVRGWQAHQTNVPKCRLGD